MATTIRFQLRGDSAENWTSKNPVLLKNEPGYDTTNRRLKLGDGVHAWNELEYLKDDNTLSDSYKRLVAFAQNHIANTNNVIDPPGEGENITVPEGVNTIYISGCGAGGGMGIVRNKYISGWNGGYCRNLDFEVKPGDILNVKVGHGGEGQTIRLENDEYVIEGSCSRGQDSIVTLNGEEILRLSGGNGGTKDHTGNQVGTEFAGHAGADTLPLYQPATFREITLPRYIYYNNQWMSTFHSDFYQYKEGFNCAESPFTPYGIGGNFCNPDVDTGLLFFHSNSSNVLVPSAFTGTNGLIIIEFGMTMINISDFFSRGKYMW